MGTRPNRDKIRIMPLTIDEARLISLLTTEERKTLLIQAAKEKARRALANEEAQKAS